MKTCCPPFGPSSLQGLGKKRIVGRSGGFKAEFLHWHTGDQQQDRPSRRSSSAMGDFARMSNQRSGAAGPEASWTIPMKVRSFEVEPTASHHRSFTAPSRLYKPPEELPVEALMQSSYQKTYCFPSAAQQPSSRSSRPSTSLCSTGLPSPAAVATPLPCDVPRPVTPPPSAKRPSPIATPMAELAVPPPAASEGE